MAGETSTGKVCVVCKQDCSKRPRIKDPQGRYTCQACADKLAAKQQVAAVPVGAASSGAKASEALPDEPELSIDLLAEEAKAQASVATDQVIDLSPAAPVPAKSGRGGGKLPAYPGMRKDEAPSKCAKCGYSLAGSASLKCPECGHVTPPRDYKTLLDEQSRALARKTWLQPVIVGVICLAISAALQSIGPAGWVGAVVMLVGWAVMIPIGLIAFFLCTLVFLEFDAPWGITSLRFGQILAIMTLPGALLASLGLSGGVPVVGGILTFALMVTLCITILELEKADAIWLTLVIVAVQIAVILGLAAVAAAIFA
jgi:hypothetical protein